MIEEDYDALVSWEIEGNTIAASGHPRLAGGGPATTPPRTTRGPGDPMALAGRYKVDRSISLDDIERAIEEGATGR